MKYAVYFTVILLLLSGCREDSPDAEPVPDDQGQNSQVDVPSPPKPFANSIGMTLVYVPPGEFMMGSRDSAEEVTKKGSANSSNFTDEHPRHRVKITNGFYMGKKEVTQFQYEEIMNNNPSHFK